MRFPQNAEGSLSSHDSGNALSKLNGLEVPEAAQISFLNLLQDPRSDHQLLWSIVANYPWKNQIATSHSPEQSYGILEEDTCLFGECVPLISDILKLNSTLPIAQQKIIVLTGAHKFERQLAAQSIARALGRPFYAINCDKKDIESTFSTGFAGNAPFTGEKSGPGEILRAFCTTGVANPVVIINNLDALSKSEVRNLFSCINPEGAHQIHDNFVQLDVPTTQACFIFTADSEADIPRSIAKRIDQKLAILRLSPHRRDQKIDIVFTFILQSLLNGYSLPEETLESINRYIPAIVDACSPNGSSLASIKSCLAKIITHCAICTLQQPEETFVLTPRVLEELLPALSLDDLEMTPEIFSSVQQQLSDPHLNKAAYLRAISSFPWKKGHAPQFNEQTALQALHAKDIGIAAQIRRIYEIIATHHATPAPHRRSLCLIGNEGTGKTMLTDAIAQALEVPKFAIDMSGKTRLNGESEILSPSEPGALFAALCATRTKSPVVVLENIDKSRPSSVASLIHALNATKNGKFRDHFAGFDINLSEVVFVATAADPSLIPAKLLDQLELVYLEGYTPDQKLSIAKKHFLPAALRDRALPQEAIEEVFTALPTLVEHVTPQDKGLNGLNRAIQSLVNQQTASLFCYGKTLNLTPENVLSFIDPLLTTHQVSEGKNTQARCNEVLKRLNLTLEQFKLIDNHITALKPWKGADALTLLYMDWIEKFPFNTTIDNNATPEKAMAQLNQTHAGLGNIKENIIDFLAGMHFSQRQTGEKTHKILCFVGGPGIGKTTFSESIATALERPFARIALESIHTLKGGAGDQHEMFGDGPGPLGKALCTTGTLNPVILLEEIDKAHPRVICQLLEVLDPAQNKNFRDSFLGFNLDLSKVIFIASANDLSQIPAPLRDRLHMIHMEPYSQQERIDIAHNMIIPHIVKSMGFDEATAQELHNLAHPLVETIMKTEYGVRNLKRFLMLAADKFARMLLEQGHITPLSASQLLGDLHAELLQSDPATIPADQPVIGITNGMYANGRDGGGICKIEASVIPYGKGKLIKTLLHGKMSQESHSRTLAHIKSLAKKYSINPEIFSVSDFLFSDQTYHQVDGPSAGIAQAIALISALTNRAVKPGYAMTGAIDAYGNLLPVGGYRAKILGTERAGIKNILLPECSRATIEKIRKDFPEVNITYIKNLDEAVTILLEEEPMQ